MIDSLKIDTDNLLVLPGHTALAGFREKDIPLNLKYIYLRITKAGGKLYSVQTILRALLNPSPGIETLADIKGDLPFICLRKVEDLLQLEELETDLALVCSDTGRPLYALESASLWKNKVLYEKIIYHFQEEIFLTDKHGKILLVNPRGAEIIGLPPEEMEGRMINELIDKKLFSSSGSLAVLKNKRKVDIMQYMKKSKRWRLCTGIPVLNEQDEIMFTLCTSKDMTELVETKKELEDKEDELKRLDNELTNMQDELFAQVNFISKSEPMRQIKETIKKIAPLDLTVMIQGETGVGKEVVARAIHALSPRRNKPFVKISCASFPDTLISSELFGYESGAFTGADARGRKGKIELSEGGTLFLDEIGEISQDLQVKLLEFLQDMQLFRIGGTQKVKVNTRIIAATNRNLEDEVQQGNFRKDLYYRLNLIPVTIPPLRERTDDIPALIRYYLDLYNRKHDKNVNFDDQVVKEFVGYHWPGNVRELEHVLERAVVIHDSGIGTRESFTELLTGARPKNEGVYCTDIIPYKKAKRQLERELVEKAYKMYGSTYKAAEVLGIAQSTVVRIMKRLSEAKE